MQICGFGIGGCICDSHRAVARDELLRIQRMGLLYAYFFGWSRLGTLDNNCLLEAAANRMGGGGLVDVG